MIMIRMIRPDRLQNPSKCLGKNYVQKPSRATTEKETTLGVSFSCARIIAQTKTRIMLAQPSAVACIGFLAQLLPYSSVPI
jgi:hypothetical protein